MKSKLWRDDDDVNLWEEVQNWPSPERTSTGNTCLVEKEMGGISLLELRDGEELVGLATLGMPRWQFFIMDNAYGWYGDIVTIFHLTTARPGYGLALMRAIVEICIEYRWELRWNCTDESRGFYKKIGFNVEEDEHLFCITPEELDEWHEKLLLMNPQKGKEVFRNG